MSETLIRTTDLSRHYHRGSHTVRALDELSLSLNEGELLAVVGASGSGKSTLLNLLAGMDTPTSGSIEFQGRELSSFTRHELAKYRAQDVSMVFQSFNLIHHRTALQNVELGLFFQTVSPRERRERSMAILERLGLGERHDHRPADLSGGEQQRVALARALVKKPRLLLADEPTGNLDGETTDSIANLLNELNNEGLTTVLVTHDLEFASRVARKTIRLRYGRLSNGDSVGGES